MFIALLSLGACDTSDPEPAATTEPGTSGATMDPSESGEASGEASSSESGDESGEDSGGSSDSGNTGPLQWSQVAGPCGGSKTNALWFDDHETGFVGCGENAEGEGLYTTLDGGATWEDNIRFGEVRIMDIRRGPDGVLRGAGIHQLDGYPVWSFDESGATIDAQGLYTPSNSAFLAVNQAENIAVTGDGQMFIDSLTGVTAAYAAAGEFEEVSSLSEDLLMDPDALSFQVRRVTTFNNRFYAVGSLINDPARIHLPSQLDGATYHFHTVELQPQTRDGELLDIHVWGEDHMIVAGHDQSEHFPLLYLLDGGDAYDAEAWEKIELFDSGLDYQAGINDLYVQGDTVVAAGEKIPTAAGGFLIMSTDGGRTWEDITPPTDTKVGTLSRVWMFEDGAMVVAGGGGEMWRYAAAE